jgi:hypothetical protein
MSNPATCPFCGSRQIFFGSIHSPKGHYFVPDEAQAPLVQFAMCDRIDFGSGARVCANCGVLWAYADPERVRAFIEGYGSETAIATLKDTSKPTTPSSNAAT